MVYRYFIHTGSGYFNLGCLSVPDIIERDTIVASPCGFCASFFQSMYYLISIGASKHKTDALNVFLESFVPKGGSKTVILKIVFIKKIIISSLLTENSLWTCWSEYCEQADR